MLLIYTPIVTSVVSYVKKPKGKIKPNLRRCK